jgi:2-polyprenyl-6-methoxyphenol hydroxylase-like FAD-dependent oxidoreductase
MGDDLDIRDTTTDIDTDVVVVGARCAGAATAMLLARQGIDVVVVDRATELGDTMSTHLIARGGVVELARWGLLDELTAAGTPALTSVTFHVAGAAHRRDITHLAGVDHLIAPRRRVLDNVLLAAAWEAGAHVLLGTSVHDVTRDGTGRVTGVTASPSEGGPPMTIRAKLVVGADGIRSRIARAVEAPDIEAFVPDTGALFSYFDGVGWDGVELFASEGMFAGIFPTNDAAACVWIMSTADVIDAIRAEHGSAPLDFERVVRALAPELADRIEGAHRVERVRVASRFPSFVRQAAGPGWALVGDAGYFRDPITGHGITDAFRDAELLARAAGAWLSGRLPERASLDSYVTARDAALRPVFEVTNAMAAWPDVTQFVRLQKQFTRLSDAEAEELASAPLIAGSAAVAAA